MEVYVIAGQSNALGISPVAGVVKKQDFDGILIYASSNRPSPRFGKVLPMGYGFGADEQKFGLEAGIAEVLKSRHKEALLVKYASDGTSLYDRWNPTLSGEDYRGLLCALCAAEEWMRQRHENPEWKGFFWMQGENDALFEEQAEYYHENLLTFISAVRERLGDRLPFVIGESDPENERLTYVSMVNGAKKRASQELRDVLFVPTGDLTQLIDSFHYTAENMLKLGRRMALKIIE